MTTFTCIAMASVAFNNVPGGQTIRELLQGIARDVEPRIQKLSIWNVGVTNILVDANAALLGVNSLVLLPNSLVVIPGRFNDLSWITVNPENPAEACRINIMQEAD